MQTPPPITIEALYMFTWAESFTKYYTFDEEPSEAEVMLKMLSALDREQLKMLGRIEMCQVGGRIIPTIERHIKNGDNGHYYFSYCERK